MSERRVSDEEAAYVIGAHFRRVDERRDFFRWARMALQNRFWEEGGNPWERFAGVRPIVAGKEDNEFPIRMQVNWIRPFLSSFTSNLFLRQPRSSAEPPRVRARRTAGRPKKRQPEAIAALVDDWLTRSDVQAVATNAYRLALMYDHAAFKVGWNEDATDPISRCWIDAVPRWQCGWDERATHPLSQAYRFHVRWERFDVAEEIVGATLPADYQKAALPDWLVDGAGRPTHQDHQSWEGYVHLCEFYDLVAREQRFYLIDGSGNSSAAGLTSWGSVEPIPYTMPDGSPGIPLIPIVLAPVPDFPFQGMSAVEPIYHLNAERNFLLTIIANAMRRDANRVLLYLQNRGIDANVLNQIRQGKDWTLIGLNGETLEGLVKHLDAPQIAQSLERYRAWLDEDRQAAQGSSDIAQGRQGKYLSATEAQLLAEVGEVTTSEIAETMQEALSRSAELMLVITGSHLDGELEVDHGAETYRLGADDLTSVHWTIDIQDATTTPVKEATKRAEFLQVAPMLEQLVVAASAEPVEAGAAPTDPAAPAPAGPTPEAVLYAQRALDYVVQTWRLPESLSWSNLAASVSQVKAKKPAAPKGLTVEEAEAMLAQLVPDLAAAQLPQRAPVAPPVPEGM